MTNISAFTLFVIRRCACHKHCFSFTGPPAPVTNLLIVGTSSSRQRTVTWQQPGNSVEPIQKHMILLYRFVKVDKYRRLLFFTVYLQQKKLMLSLLITERMKMLWLCKERKTVPLSLPMVWCTPTLWPTSTLAAFSSLSLLYLWLETTPWRGRRVQGKNSLLVSGPLYAYQLSPWEFGRLNTAENKLLFPTIKLVVKITVSCKFMDVHSKV